LLCPSVFFNCRNLHSRGKLGVWVIIDTFSNFVLCHSVACKRDFPCCGLGCVFFITNRELKTLLLGNLV
jgi:hypothetical protein